MKTPLKIFILIAGVMIVAVCIYVYMRIIMAPPLEISDENQYVEHLKKETQNFKDSRVDDPEDEFVKYSDLSNRFLIENKISENDARENYAGFISAYAPKYVAWCQNKFEQPAWNRDELDWMEKRAEMLENVTDADGNRVIANGDAVTAVRISDIKETVGKYREASKLVGRRYKSLADSRRDISRAREFQNDPWLKYNQSLMTALKKLPEVLGKGHYGSVADQVASLAKFENYTRGSYDTYSTKVNNSINEFATNARSLYGIDNDVSKLRKEASEHMNNANKFFDRKEYNEKQQNAVLQNELSI